MLASLVPRRLDARLAAILLGIILTIQLAGYAAIRAAIDDSVTRNADTELAVGERVLDRLLAQSGQRLAQASQVLAGDYAFREAIASRDANTVRSALENHGGRIGAGVAMFVDLDGTLTASTRAAAETPRPVLNLIAQIGRDGSDVGSGLLGGVPYRIVAVPVRAPLPLGWVVMGFRIEDALLHDFTALTGVAASLAVQDGGGAWRLHASGLAPAGRAALAATLTGATPGAGATVTLDDVRYRVQHAPLATLDGTAWVAVLQRSLSDAASPFHRLQGAFLLLTGAGLALSLLGSYWASRRVTGPVSALAEAARSIEQGDYATPIATGSADEIGNLAAAMEHMRTGIAARERRISELAFSDSLTGLPNRALFNDRIEQAVAVARRHGSRLAVLQLDLDRFKLVNDTLGHQMGDRLLREVGARIAGALQRTSDTVARLGGDEFAVLLPTESVDGAVRVAQRLAEVLAEPMVIEGQLVDVGASIGVAGFPDHGSDAPTLLRCADVAMYGAKRNGSGVGVYDPRHDENTPERLSLMAELRRAVERDELLLLYQPKLGLSGRRVECCEALLRWEHPVRGVVPPGSFIPFAEQTGYIKAITRWVIDKALAQSAHWRGLGLDLGISVNTSARDLQAPDFARYVEDRLHAHGVPPDRLWLEVTESAVMDDPTHALENLDRIAALGVRLSIDDFGTGYSSLAYLKKLPVSELKIDRSFVQGLTTDRDDAIIVRSTIDLAHNMGLTVTAEGVEDADSLEVLKGMGCDVVQGYHVSRPLTAAALERWLRQAANAEAEPVERALAGTGERRRPR